MWSDIPGIILFPSVMFFSATRMSQNLQEEEGEERVEEEVG